MIQSRQLRFEIMHGTWGCPYTYLHEQQNECLASRSLRSTLLEQTYTMDVMYTYMCVNVGRNCKCVGMRGM